MDKIWPLVKYSLLIVCKNDVIMCCEYKPVCLNWCCQLLPSFNGELYLVH